MRKLVLLIFSICCVSGCIVPSQQAMKAPENLGNQARTPPLQSEPSALIKPVISPENSEKPKMVPAGTDQSEAPTPTTERPELDPKPADDQSGDAKELDDAKVRTAGIELAKLSPAVKKMGICYSVKDDEWWVTLYEPAGNVYELKSFTWNPEQEKLEPFLVPKRVPIAEFDNHLAEAGVGKLCKLIDVNK
jgi:hypothetical protein